MRLNEFIEADIPDKKTIRNYLMDVLLPLYDGGVPFVSIQSVQDALDDLELGIQLDDDYVMNLLSPDSFKIIKKIEDDKVYFDLKFDPTRVVSDSEGEKEQKKFDKMVSSQANKEMNK